MAQDNGNREAKEATVAKMLNLNDENKEAISQASDAELDSLVNTVMSNLEETSNLNKSVDHIVECIELMNRPSEEIVECIHRFTGMKLTEAQDIYDNILFERKMHSNNTLDKIYEKLG